MPQEVVWNYDHEEAKGRVAISENPYGYGPSFTVTAPAGTEYTGCIDLFHFVPDHEGCLQLIIDGIGDSAQTFHTRFYPDGRVETFSE